MNALDQAKKAWQRFKKDRPGWRFENFYSRWHERRKGPWRVAARLGLGLLLIVAGLALGLVPGIPGIVLGAAGLAAILFQFRAPAVCCDVAEIMIRSLLHKWHRRWARS